MACCTRSRIDLTLPTITFDSVVQIVIPAPKRKGQGENLVAIKSLPQWAQPAFEGMASLNTIQSKVCDTALNTANNMLVCAPTGSGKTNVAVLSILHELGNALQSDGTIAKDKFKVVYIAPMKALVAEMVGNFQQRLDARYGITTKELTGARLPYCVRWLLLWSSFVAN